MNYPPKYEKDDVIEEAAINVLDLLIPGFSIFYNSYLPSEYLKRKDRWLHILAEKMNDLETGLEKLKSEEGITLFLNASRKAVETHKREKLFILGEILCGVLKTEQMQYDRKELILEIAKSLELVDVCILRVLSEEKQRFFSIRTLDPIYDFLSNNNLSTTKDEFLYSLNKMELLAVVRKRSSGLVLTGDVPNPDGFGSPDDGKLPAIKVTDLGEDLMRYLSFHYKIRH